MERYPIPSNMEGQVDRSPYSRLNTLFNPRLFASDLAMGALPGPAGLIDRATGSNVRNQMDRLTGATSARNQRDYDAYMRGLMRNDPGNERNSIRSRIGSWFNQALGGEGGASPGAMTPAFNPYSPPMEQGSSSSSWGTTGPAPILGFQQFMGPSSNMTPAPMYGTGRGMFRAPPAPLYGAGQGMMRAPAGGGGGEGGGGGSSGGGGGSSSGGGVLSPGGRLLSHGVATRLY